MGVVIFNMFPFRLYKYIATSTLRLDTRLEIRFWYSFKYSVTLLRMSSIN
jgi:hypothetical protein